MRTRSHVVLVVEIDRTFQTIGDQSVCITREGFFHKSVVGSTRSRTTVSRGLRDVFMNCAGLSPRRSARALVVRRDGTVAQPARGAHIGLGKRIAYISGAPVRQRA